jgi:hypothetical protein
VVRVWRFKSSEQDFLSCSFCRCTILSRRYKPCTSWDGNSEKGATHVLCLSSSLKWSFNCGSYQHLVQRACCRFRSSLVGFGKSTNRPSFFLKCVLLAKTRQRSSAWILMVEKHQQNHNLIYSSLTLGTLTMMRLMCVVHFMGGKIRRVTMNVALKHFCQKEWNCLTNVRIVNFIFMYQTFSWLRQSSPKDATFSLFNYDYEIKGSDVMNNLKKQDMLSLVKLNQASCNSNMFTHFFMCIPESRKAF